MKSGKIVVLLVLSTVLLLTVASGVNAAVEEVVWEYEGYYVDYITVKVTAPAQASPGDTITIEVAVRAEQDLEDVVVDVRIDGTKSEGTDTWKSKWKTDVIDVSSLDDGDKENGDCDVDIPDDADPGLICGEIHCELFSVDDDEAYEFDTAFPMTYLLGAITEEEYEALKSELETAKSDLATAESELATAESELATAESELATAKSDLATAESELATAKSDLATAISERDTAKSERDTARSERDTAISERNTAISERDAARSELDTTAEKLSDYETYVYILIGTTILFVATTIVFAVRRPKAV